MLNQNLEIIQPNFVIQQILASFGLESFGEVKLHRLRVLKPISVAIITNC